MAESGMKELHDIQYISEEELAESRSVVPVQEIKQSIWQMVAQQYKPSILWSAFMGLAAIHSGTDVSVSISFSFSLPIHI